MSRSFEPLTDFLSLLTVSAIALAGGQQAERGAQDLEVRILVYNYAHVPENSLSRAKREAARTLREAGIGTAWRDCPLEAAGSAIPTCEQLIDKNAVVLRIVERFQIAAGLTNKQTLGSSVGSYATVSYKWVLDEAASGVAPPSEILGPAIAHEIGHLLLRQPGHSGVGIMRSRWTREDFQRAPLGSFMFTPQQAETMRATVAERSKAKVASQISRAAKLE